MGRCEVLFKCCYFASDGSCISNNPLNISHLPSHLVVCLSSGKQARSEVGEVKVCCRRCYPAGERYSGCGARFLRRCLGILHIREASTTEFKGVMARVHIFPQRFEAPKQPVGYKGHPHQKRIQKAINLPGGAIAPQSQSQLRHQICFLKGNNLIEQ